MNKGHDTEHGSPLECNDGEPDSRLDFGKDPVGGNIGESIAREEEEKNDGVARTIPEIAILIRSMMESAYIIPSICHRKGGLD